MKLDKSRIILFGALVVLVIVLVDGSFDFHFFGLMHGTSWVRWVLFGLLFWLLFSRRGCCGKSECNDSKNVEDDSSDKSSEDTEGDSE
ncbi:MAG: hypothetical protein BMS9Abin05_1352 [Rhodothermia bacterium]|nr:MAG: hypothetical protein BMS9Abin05_1352 [Rhodothermia bacterium]